MPKPTTSLIHRSKGWFKSCIFTRRVSKNTAMSHTNVKGSVFLYVFHLRAEIIKHSENHNHVDFIDIAILQ